MDKKDPANSAMEGKVSNDEEEVGDTSESGNSSMEKKDRVTIDGELVDLHNAMEAMISSMHAAGKIRNRLDDYSVKYNIPELGCRKKETDDQLDNRLDNLKSEHYRTEDCINSTLEKNAAAAADDDDGDDQSGENSSDGAITCPGSEGKGSNDDVGSTSTKSGSSSADLEHDVSADDTEGSMGGSDEEN